MLRLDRYLYPHFTALVRVFKCVREEIGDNLLEIEWVGRPKQLLWLIERELYLLLLGQRLEPLVLFVEQTCDGDRLDLCVVKPFVFRFAEIQDLLDQLVQFCHIVTEHGTVFLQLRMLLLVGIAMDVVVHPIDQCQRGTKLMGDVCEEVQLRLIKLLLLLLT